MQVRVHTLNSDSLSICSQVHKPPDVTECLNMVLELEGISECHVQVWTHQCKLICSRHFFTSISVSKLKLYIRRAPRVLSNHIIKVSWCLNYSPSSPSDPYTPIWYKYVYTRAAHPSYFGTDDGSGSLV